MKGIRLLRIAVVFTCLGLLLFGAGGSSAVIAAGPDVWTQSGPSGFGDINNQAVSAVQMFNGKLYAGTINWAAGGSVWSSPDAKTWTQVIAPGVISKPNVNVAILGMAVFNNKLYISTGWGSDYGGQLWSYDGTNAPSLVLNNQNMNGFTVFAAYKGKLYLGTTVLRYATPGASIYEMAPDGTWRAVVTNGLSSRNSYAVTGFAVFNNVLYAAVANDVEGAEIWSFDGILWRTVVSGGFGDVKIQDMGGMAVFNNELYVGARHGSLMEPVSTSTGGRLFKTANGANWTPVITNGFGNANNIKIEGVFPFAGRLFATTTNPTTGMEVWTSWDGASWSQAATNGFGNAFNLNTLWNNSIFTIGTQIYIGTFNMNPQSGQSVTGGQIWTYDPPAFVIHQQLLPYITQ